MNQEGAESIAIQALSFLAETPERLGRFLALTGISPAEIRVAARNPDFLAGVLEHVAGDESLLLAFAGRIDLDPAEVGAARATLGGRAWEQDVP